jgi:ADP-glucose pyrophosphorylase
MHNFVVCFFEVGFPRNDTEIFRDLDSLEFPFWGNWHFIDFALSNFSALENQERIVFLEERKQPLVTFLSLKWKKEMVTIQVVKDIIEDFTAFLERTVSEVVILLNLSQIALYSLSEIEQIAMEKKDEITKITVNKSPLDLFIANRKNLLQLFRQYKRKTTPKTDLFSVIFDDILFHSFDSIIDIQGETLFNNNLMHLYHNNLYLIAKAAVTVDPAVLNTLSKNPVQERESYIASNGHVKNSFIASGVTVSGYVENSVVFSDVIIGKNAQVSNSVIMSKNQVGKGAIIQNSVIFPFFDEIVKGVSNIGEKCYIGGNSPGVQNKDFPEQVTEGITFIGANADIPRDFRIEAACIVGSNVAGKELKKLEKLKKGQCYQNRMEK